MFEVLKIIVLACQVSGGGEKGSFTSYIYEDIDEHQKKCQKELIKCVVFNGDTSASDSDKLVQCLYKR